MTLAPTVNALVQRAGIIPGELESLVRLALNEDLRYGPDVTSLATIDPEIIGTGDVVARASGVIAGVPIAYAVLDLTGFPLDGVTTLIDDGGRVERGSVVARLHGPVLAMLIAERTLLNFMTHLSGVATSTRSWVDAVEPFECRVRDTRKTIPGMRQLEKYAVRCGGGLNHRFGLGDAALIKDNHVAAAGGIVPAFNAVRAASTLKVEVECDTLDQVRDAVAAGCRYLLLDNMDLDQIRECVAVIRATPGIRIEVSGGLTLDKAHDIAATGVDYLAVGALTHSSPVLDLALDLAAFPPTPSV